MQFFDNFDLLFGFASVLAASAAVIAAFRFNISFDVNQWSSDRKERTKRALKADIYKLCPHLRTFSPELSTFQCLRCHRIFPSKQMWELEAQEQEKYWSSLSTKESKKQEKKLNKLLDKYNHL